MSRSLVAFALVCVSFLVGSQWLIAPCSAQTVWSGYGFSFAKPDFADPTLPTSQDRLTADVWLTRATNQGLFNIHDEGVYVAPASPTGTEWATDLNNPEATIAATNWSHLTFTDWIDGYGGQGTQGLPGRLIGRNAVLHLINDNVYLDLRFTDWTQGGGGGFSYDRALAPLPPSTTGDYNHNGVVDAADYVAWRDSLNQTVVPAGSGADGSGNGIIDADDYTFWRSRFGNAVGSGAGSRLTGSFAVPEPSGLWQIGCLLIFMCRRRAAIRMRRHPVFKLRAMRLCLVTNLAIFTTLAGVTTSAKAAFHLWQVKEVFTNASGSVQFVEMFDNSPGETAVNGFKLRSNSDGVIKEFTFPSNLVNSTPGHMLIATSGFGSLTGGVTPTFTFDQSSTALTLPFFNPNATNITFTFTGSNDTMTLTGASLPKDGIHSLTDANASGFPNPTSNNSSGVNSPTNLLGSSGGINLSSGDYNGNHVVDAADYAVWRKTPANFGTNAAGYAAWRSHFDNPAGSGLGSGLELPTAAPEPAAGALFFVAILALRFARHRR